MQRRFTDAPADQSTTASAATRLAAHHSHLSDRARTALLPSAAPDADFNAHGKRRGGCLQLRCRQTLPALPLWQIKAERFVLSEDRSHFRLRLRHRCCDRVSLMQQSLHLPSRARAVRIAAAPPACSSAIGPPSRIASQRCATSARLAVTHKTCRRCHSCSVRSSEPRASASPGARHGGGSQMDS